MHSIATVINFCTNDFQFLDPCVRETKKFSSQILIPVCDHFYDGTPENRDLLNLAYQLHSNCDFIEFAYDPDNPYGFPSVNRPLDLHWRRYWHSSARLVSYFYLQKEIEYVLFIDVDEVYEGEKFKAWLDQFDYRSYNAIRFLCYQYFREPRFRAKAVFNSGLLTRREVLTPENILNIDERLGLYLALPEKKILHQRGIDGLPFIHHYSWVRSKEQMLKKVITWGHYWEKDWPSMVEKEFSHPFSGKDFCSDLEYETVEPYIPTPRPSHRTNPQEIFRKALDLEFGLSEKTPDQAEDVLK